MIRIIWRTNNINFILSSNFNMLFLNFRIIIAKQEVHTAGEAKKLELEADTEGIGITADGSDMMMVYAYVKDADGTVCHDASNELKFSIVQGLKMFLRPSRCSDRPMVFAIRSNGNTE